MLKITVLCFFIIAFISCKNTPSDLQHTTINPEIVYDSIFTRLPGNFEVKDNYFIWQDALAKDSFIHVVDIADKKEILKTGKIGKGPNEFRTPALGTANPFDFIVYDFNGNNQFFFSLDSFLSRKKHFYSVNLPSPKATTARLAINDTTIISLCPDRSSLFVMNQPKSVSHFGQMPFKQKYSNGFYINQGRIEYNDSKKILVFAAAGYPYLCIYKWKKEKGFVLEKEIKDKFEYEYSKEEIIPDQSKAGAFSMALTKNYIVIHRRDYEKDNTDERTVGRDVSKVPRTIFLYDYKGNLKKIVDLKMPIIRIAADVNQDDLYAIVANPDYTLVHCKL